MAASVTLPSFDPSTLLSYYSAQLAASPSSVAAASAANATAASAANSATANDNPPWENLNPPSQQAEDAQVLSTTNFFDLSNVPLIATSTDQKLEQDNQKLFTLYTGINQLSYLAGMANRDGITDGQRAGYNTRLQQGLAQLQTFLKNQTFNNLTLQAQNPSASVTSTLSIPLAQTYFTGRTLVTGDAVGNPLANVSAGQSFTVQVSKGGVAQNVDIDLSQVTGGLTLDNIVNYMNQQMAAAGFSTRFQRAITSGSINDPTTAGYGITVDRAGSETVSLSSSQAAPALYLAGASGNPSATADNAADQQGRLVKLTNLDSSPQAVFNATADPTTGNTTAQSTVVDASGNVYVLGNATGDFGNQLNQGSQDVYLTKYDSAGNLLWTQLLGSSGTASGMALALDPTGGVVVAGTTDANLSQTAVADGNNDSFVAKYGADGSLAWTHQIQTLADNQGLSLSVGSDGTVTLGGQVQGSVGAGQTDNGGTDGYLATFNSKGKLTAEQQLGTAGADQVSALATGADGSLYVASVQNGDAIVAKYANGDIASSPVWSVDLGSLQAKGAVAGLAVNGSDVYVSGTTSNASLTASGAATVAASSSGGLDSFVFHLSDQGAAAQPQTVSYVGTSSSDSAGSLAVAADGTVYLTGTTKGTFAGQTRSAAGTDNMFVSALNADGSIAWTRQYGGASGQSTGNGVAIDTTGASVLDALGLPKGVVDVNQQIALTNLTTVRAGDSFSMKIDNGTVSRTATVTIDSSETLQTLVNKITDALGPAGKASIAYGSGGKTFQIAANAGMTITLTPGAAGFDALSPLGIAAGIITQPGTGSSSSSSSSTGGTSQAFGLGLQNNLDISTQSGAGAARANLLNVLSSVRNVYRTITTPAPAAGTATQSSGTAPAYLTAQIANYTLALNTLSGGSTSSSTLA